MLPAALCPGAGLPGVLALGVVAAGQLLGKAPAVHAAWRSQNRCASSSASCAAASGVTPGGLPGSGGGGGSTGGSSTAAVNTAAAPAPQIAVKVNGRQVMIPVDGTLLDATTKAGVVVPTLCKHPKLEDTPGTCRVCMVEADGRVRPACCTPAWDGAVVDTDSQAVRESVRGTLALLRANHPEDCMSCDVNGRCEFQTLITRYKVPKLPKLSDVSPDYIAHSAAWASHAHDQSSAAIGLDLDKCIKCGRCVSACAEQGMNVLGMFERGRDRHIGFVYESDMELSKCIECGQCVSVCPVGALTEHTEWRQVLELLQTKRKIMVVQTAPAVRVAIGEELGLAPGAISTGEMVAGLRRLGFDYVFDTDFTADLTIMEEGTEFIQRLSAAWQGQEGGPPLPMFTSCCPAWVNLVESDFPELIPHLSSCKSPQQMMGAVVKEVWARRAGVKPQDVVLVSIMPCVAKKHEAERPEMESDCDWATAEEDGAGARHAEKVRHVDYVLTTRELGALMRHCRVPMAGLPQESYDNPLGIGTGAGVLFGASGGVMEAAVRTVYEVVSGTPMPRLDLTAVRGLDGVKEAELAIPLPDGDEKSVRIAVASGISHARELLKRIKAGTAPEYHFIEVMSCPGGCIGGGGQPKAAKPKEALAARMKAIYALDKDAPLRKSHLNPQVQELYADVLQKPGSHLSHELLHTHYHDRSSEHTPAYTSFQRADAPLPPEVVAAKQAESNIPGPPPGLPRHKLMRRF